MKITIVEMVGGHGGMNGLNHPLINSISIHENARLFTAMHGFRSDNVRNWFDICHRTNNKLLKGFLNVAINVLIIFNSTLRRTRIYHLHFYQYGFLQAALVFLYKMTGRKVIVSAHDASSFSKLERDRFKAFVFRGADTVLTHSHYSCDQVRRYSEEKNLSLNVKMVELGPPTAGIDIIAPEVAKMRIGVGKDDFTLLFFGQIKDVKGLDIVLKALPLLQVDNLKLVIAGRPWHTDFSTYLELIETLGLTNKVKLHIKYIPDKDVPYFFSAADVVCLPYRKIYQSGVLLYALCYEKIIVCSDLEPFTEIVTDGVNGFVFKAGSVESFASVIQTISDLTISDIASVKRASKNLIDDKFNWGNLALKTIDIYRELDKT